MVSDGPVSKYINLKANNIPHKAVQPCTRSCIHGSAEGLSVECRSSLAPHGSASSAHLLARLLARLHP